MKFPVPYFTWILIGTVLSAPSMKKTSKSLTASPPSEWQVCSQNDPHQQECLIKSLNLASKSLVNGNPKFGLPALNPLKIPAMKLKQTSSGVDFSLELHDVFIMGLPGNITSASLKMGDMKPMELTYGQEVDAVVITARYNMKGSVLRLPVTGVGKTKFALAGVQINTKLSGTPEEKNGYHYWNKIDASLRLITEDLYCQFDGLFGGNKALGDAMNKALNENWRQIFQEIRGTIEEPFSTMTKEFAQRFFSKVPIETVFPTK